MANIEFMGAGIGGVPMAYEMKAAMRKEDHITVISNNPYFQLTPSNPWAAVGWRKKGDITIDLAQPQNPPRNKNWASEGRWVHWAKIAFEKYFMRKIRKGQSEPYFEKMIMKLTSVTRLKE